MKLIYGMFPVLTINEDDETVLVLSTRNNGYKDKIQLYWNPCTKIDNGAKCSVVNQLYYVNCNIMIKNLNAMWKWKEQTVPTAAEHLQMKANNTNIFIDVKSFYSSNITSTLISENMC